MAREAHHVDVAVLQHAVRLGTEEFSKGIVEPQHGRRGEEFRKPTHVCLSAVASDTAIIATPRTGALMRVKRAARAAGERAWSYHHIDLRRSATSSAGAPAPASAASSTREPESVTASSVFKTFSVMKRLRPPYTCASDWRA